MDRFLQRGCREPSPPALHLHTSDQTRGTGSSSESRKHALKRERTSEETDAADSPLLAALCGSGVDAAEQRVVAATRHGAQPGGGAVMMSTAGQALREPGHDVITAPKEERKGKRAMMMRGWKRDAVIRTRKEKYTDVFAPSALPELLSRDGHCAAEWMGAENENGQENGMIGMNGLNGLNGLKSGSAAVVSPAVKKHRGADKLDSMFPVASPPAPVAVGPPGSSPKQVVVMTRSIGTNTPDGAGAPGGPEPDSACLGPCQPGTSVNLEGIVWHETDEGVLVVNVTWRKRTYVGTLLDCTKHDWAPPRFCESPSSDPEMQSGRGRGKRMRLAISERPCVEPLPVSKVRGLSQHRSRGGGVTGASGPIHSKGRRGSLNLMNSSCRAPPSFFTVEEVKPASSTTLPVPGKRKVKPPGDLDLSLLASDDNKLGNGKRIRAKSRSAPSTPQGKADPSFMDPGGGCTSSSPPPPILIDCPHPNCTKRYKHINGLRYHQTHAHLEVGGQRKPELESLKDAEGGERLSDCEDAPGSRTYNLSEASSASSNSANASSANASSSNASSANTSGLSSSKKAAPLYKVTTVGSPKNRRLLLSTDTAKTRRTSLLRDGLMDDLSNLPIISNMTVVLENCMVPDRSSTVEMPKLEAEGLIDKKGGVSDKGKKANGKAEKLSKSRANRPIAPAPPPPKLIAVPSLTNPNSVYNTSSSGSPSPVEPHPASTQPPHQPLPPQPPIPLVSGGLSSKNPPLTPLKPIKPKLGLSDPCLGKTALVPCTKETRKKEKRRLKDKHSKDLDRTSSGDAGVKAEDCGGTGGPKPAAREAPGSLLKEHLSKQEVVNGLTGSQESRMASIRAEADKVYTFTDNAPSPSIGTSLRLDAGSGIASPDGDSKNNSPAYSDISDAGDDGGAVECRSDCTRSKSGPPSSSSSSSSASSSSDETPNSHHGNLSNSHQGSTNKIPPAASNPLSKDSQYYQGYDSYYLQGFMQGDRQNHCSPAFHKGIDVKGKDRKEDLKEEEPVDSKKAEGCGQSQLQLAMSQTQTALAQSLYYGQYSRALYTDQKLLLGNKCCDQALGGAKQRSDRGPPGSGRDGEDGKYASAGSGGAAIPAKGGDGTKGCCSKPTLTYTEKGERGDRGERAERGQLSSMLDQQPGNVKASSSSSSLHNLNTPTDLDSNGSYSSPPDGLGWAYRRPRCKQPHYPLGLHGNQPEEGEADQTKEWRATLEPVGAKMATIGGGGVRGGERGGGQHATPISEAEDAERLEGEEVMGEEPIGGLCEESQSARVAVSPPQQSYLPYQQTPYPPYLALTRSSQGMSPNMAHNYPGFHYPLYGKTAGREDPEGTNHTEPSSVELHQPSLLSQGKSPAPGEKGSPERERELERERNHVSFGRHLHTHHHTHLGVSYSLLSAPYDVYQGLSSRSLVTNQVTGQSPTESQGKN